jgi:hypothetical protein
MRITKHFLKKNKAVTDLYTEVSRGFSEEAEIP